MAQKVNTDITLYTILQVVLNYIVKYYIKEEKKTTTYIDLVKKVLPYLNLNRLIVSLVAKTINKLVSKRDQSI